MADGRAPRGFGFGNQTCDPEYEEEFLEWYERQHALEALATGYYNHGSMFRHTATNPPDDEGEYLLLYEIPHHDIENAIKKVYPQFAKIQADFNAQKGARRVFGGMYHIREREYDNHQPKPTNSLMVLRMDIDPEKVADTLTWYRDVHLPEAVKKGSPYHTAYLGERAMTDPAPTLPDNTVRFLAIYESEEGTAAKLAREFLETIPEAKWGSAAKITRASSFYRIAPTISSPTR
jgi:hypothetical protein